ncbi:hypothetical protein A9Q99_17535 [Gammaproteobacteria bacterium 45_16_T64]|nr:hypothetical protein A9Q99_17535 [Gammaproteobacteria bacterium 45_16_T64]
MDSVKASWKKSLFFLVVFSSQVAEGSARLSAVDAFKAIMIDGVDLPQVLGNPIKQYSLAAVIDDEMEPIPFQIDEYNEGGAVYFEGWDVPLVGTEGVFDEEDKLLFINKDAGERYRSRHRYDGKIIHEITLTDKNGSQRYAYLVEGSRLRSDEQYVRYSADEALVETDFYSITYNKENNLNWDDFSIVNYDGDENPFDALKIRLNTGVLTNMVTLELNNEDLIAQAKGERIGPIRTTTQMELIFWFLKLPFVKVSLQLHHYPNSLLYDARAILPAARRKMLVDPKIRMALEGNRLFGTEIRTASGPKQPAITDGHMDDIEKAHIEHGISIDNNWIWADTQRNLDFAAFFTFNSEREQEISFYYNDEKDILDPPERFPGQLPVAGYLMHTLPPSGFFGFTVNIHLSNGYEGEPEDFTSALRTLPAINVSSPK